MITLDELRGLASRRLVDDHIGRHFKGDSDAFVEDVNRTINQFLHGNLKTAGAFVDECRKCFSYLPPKYRPALLAIEARYAHWSGSHETALKLYDRAISLYRKRKEFQAIAKIRLGMMDAHMYLGEYAWALKTGKLALKHFLKHNDLIKAAQCQTNLGNVYHRMDKNRMALRHYDQAREVFAAKGGVPLAIVDYNRANVYANLNNLDEAEKLYRGAADIYRRNGLELIASKSEYSLAYLHFLAGRYTDALTIFDKVYDIFEELGDTAAAAVTRLDLAEINIEINQLGTAMMQGEQASDMFHTLGQQYEEAKAVFFAAVASRRLGDTSQAEKYLVTADRLFTREDNRFWSGMVALERCRLYTATGRLTDATEAGELARRLFIANADARRKCDADIALARIQYEAGRFGAAIRLGKNLLKKELIGGQEHRANHLIGQSLLRLNRPNDALKYFRAAISIVEKMMGNLLNDEIRFFFALDKYDTYLATVECLVGLGKTKDAFLQHTQALAVLNQQVVSDRVLKKEIPVDLLNQRTRLRATLKRLQRTPDETGQRHAATGREFRKIEYGLWQNERKIRAVFDPARPARTTFRSTKKNVQSHLGTDEILINFVQLNSRAGAFVVTATEIQFFRCPVSMDDLRQAIHRIHYLMERDVFAGGRTSESARAIDFYLTQLHDWLFAPLAEKLTGRKIILLVDGLFSQIPFPALTDAAGKRLKDRFSLSTIVNPDDLGRRRKSKKCTLGRSAIFAVTDIGLPMIEEEAGILSKLFPKAKLYTGDKATISALQKELSHVSGYLHIASHASRASENPLFSRILMHDGPFFPFDLFESGISAELVTLSGCQTAAPGIYYGNAFSLAKAFYQAGVRYVLASLWSVSDRISKAFMSRFYNALASGATVDRAYSIALDQTESASVNPALWSPFILIGI